MQSLHVNYHVDVTALPVAQAFLDGIVMTISYNTPTIQPGTGCIVTAANPCPAFSTVLLPPAPVCQRPGIRQLGHGLLPLRGSHPEFQR